MTITEFLFNYIFTVDFIVLGAQCITGALTSLYDVSVFNPAKKAVLNILFSVPKHCPCPLLESKYKRI